MTETTPLRTTDPSTWAATDWNRVRWSVLLALVALWTLDEVLSALPVRPHEPLVLAWARLAVEHPWRLGVALALLAWATSPWKPRHLEPGKESTFEVSSQSPSSGIVAPTAGTPAPRSPWSKP